MIPLSPQDRDFMTQVNRHPKLKARLSSLLAIAEDTGNDLVKAADAEQRVIEEVRRLGNELLTDWAETRVAKTATEQVTQGAGVRSVKKNSTGTRHSAKSP